MHGRGGENWKRQRRHMWSVPAHAPRAPPVAVISSSSSPSDLLTQSSSDSFLKDGREIRVGDCALFLAGNAPPFIGIIKGFATSNKDSFKLCVNWLYRPADVKLTKGILLEAAPNEVFYSFHTDLISAASLLHPCKVSFLGEGVDLPPGISSFVCRRVYDITNKRLFWLTDHDYTDERQEEVDQLLGKTRLEMHAGVQPGGRSPKSLNGPTSSQQLKTGTESVQNSGGASFPSQAKGKKRERGVDQGTEPIKQERSAKHEDGESANSKFDIAKITEKGSLITTEGVEKLVQLIQLDRSERKIDLAGRIRLADVIAATDRFECLGRFVQLRGVPVLDDWLQEAHKGKAGDGSSPKESDKGVEELLLALLRALDKLPVNLNALRTCNIGKSVNHLRSHKNIEIQKKARSLVDTWKKRVDAEMSKINDAKSGGPNQAVTWPVKQNSEVRQSGSTEVATRTPIAQLSACKSLVGKPGHADAVVKSTPDVPVASKMPSSLPCAAVSSKDSPPKGAGSSGNSDAPLAIVKEEKSSSSSHSQNNSQSCSSDHVKTVGSPWKEDARSSTAMSLNASKTSGSSSRHRRSSNGFVGNNSTFGVQKDASLSKSGSLNRKMALDKVSSQSERALDMPVTDHGNGHRLIVRLPNPARSPARSASGGGSLEDPSVLGSRASSPGAPDKFDHADQKIKRKADGAKQGLVGSAEGDRSPRAVVDEEHRGADETGMALDATRAAYSSSGNGKGVSLIEPSARISFSSMNALIESCANFSEPSAALSAGDDIGMNLLASVAAGEMSKSDLVSPSASPGSSPNEEPGAANDEAKSRLSCEDGQAQSRGQSDENADLDSGKQGKSVGQLVASEKAHETGKIIIPSQGNKLTTDHALQHPVPSVNLSKTGEYSAKAEVKSDERRIDRFSTACTPADAKEVLQNNGANCSAMDESTSGHTGEKIGEDTTKASDLVCNSFGDKIDSDSSASGRKPENLVPGDIIVDQQQPIASENHAEVTVRQSKDYTLFPADKVLSPEPAGASKIKKPDESEGNDADANVITRKEPSVGLSLCSEEQARSAVNGSNEVSERKETPENPSVFSEGKEPSAAPAQEVDPDRREESISRAEASTLVVAPEQDSATKLDFDLNEGGFSGDDGNQAEPAPSEAPVCYPAMRLPSISPFVSNSVANGPAATITVAAPAKGPFVPPEDLLKSKAEPGGWKGSAATSAFRPAEPRRVLEMQLNNASDVQSSNTAGGKQARPPLDIDLNVADDTALLEDMASQSSPQTTGSESGAISNRDSVHTRSTGGLDLDLNKIDEGTDNGPFLVSSSSILDPPLMSVKPAVPGGFSNGDASMFRDFDLNNGPGIDEAGGDHTLPKSEQPKNPNSAPSLPQITGLRMGNAELGNISPWYPPSNSYHPAAVAISSFLPDRGEQQQPYGAQRMLGSVSGAGSFSGDVYRGAVLSSSPAMAFSPGAAFPYAAAFPFGSTFPLSSTFPVGGGGPTSYVDSTSGVASAFPAIPPQLVGPAAGAVSSHQYARPYLINVPGGSTSAGSESGRKWVSRQGLDLNAGPGSGGDVDAKDDRVPSSSRQFPLASSQMFGDEQQARLYVVSGGSLKRKEREGGGSWDERIYKQPSWQ